MPTIQYSAQSARIGGSLGPPSPQRKRHLDHQPILQGSLGDRPTDTPTDQATRSVTIVGIYVRRRVICHPYAGT